MQSAQKDYNKIFSEIIKKQILILGPDIALAKVRNVPGIIIAPNGEVIKIAGNPQKLLEDLINQYVELSGLIVKNAMDSVISSNANLENKTDSQNEDYKIDIIEDSDGASLPYDSQIDELNKMFEKNDYNDLKRGDTKINLLDFNKKE